jgi:hypothetical protein
VLGEDGKLYLLCIVVLIKNEETPQVREPRKEYLESSQIFASFS